MNLRFYPLLLLAALPLSADTITMKSGPPVDGVIQRIEGGLVTIQAGNTIRTIDLSNVANIDFNTPHLIEGTDDQDLEHFLEEMRTPELTRLGDKLYQLREELHNLLAEIQERWKDRQTISRDQVREWQADRERFEAPMREYQETLNDLYLHVLAHVDDYNELAGEAHKLYVGVRGIFATGSPLVEGDETELPMRRFLPRKWFDEIYFQGYQDGANQTNTLRDLTEENNQPQIIPTGDDQ